MDDPDPMAAMPMNPPITVPLGGRSFTWDGQRWFGTDDYTTPPQSIAARLDVVLARMLGEEDDRITDRRELMRRAREARARTHYQRAEKIGRRLLEREPDSPAIAALLCSILRESGRASEAVALADQFAGAGCAPLLTSRAAALCDLERWAEALQQIRAVLATEASEEARAVHERIKRYAPKGVFKGKRTR